MDCGMKISIITVSYRDGANLRRTLRSIDSQVLPPDVELENILVLGDEDEHIAPEANRKVIYASPKGCYDAMNIGYQASTGNVIGFVDGTNFLWNENVINHLASVFKNENCDYLYGDVQFMDKDVPNRYYSGARFTPDKLALGFAPPHPALFLSREAMERVGLYSAECGYAADFEFIVRLVLENSDLHRYYLPECLVGMSVGGVANSLSARLWKNTLAKWRILRQHGVQTSLFKLMLRYLYNN